MDIEGVIFDMDGTISDSENVSKDVLTSLMQKEGYPFYFEHFINVIGINKSQSIEYLSTFTFDDKKSDEILTHSGQIMNQLLQQGKIPLKKGAMEIINWLNEIHFPIALATSAPMEKIKYTFNGNGYEVPFKNIVTGDMVRYSKPHPQIFLLAGEKMNVPIENCLVIEDSYNGIKAALKAKAIACMVPDLLPPNQEILTQNVMIKNDLTEVKSWLEQYVNP
ncbi:MAG: HAD family hydrolase [Erysipelotrichaceae bacterium]